MAIEKKRPRGLKSSAASNKASSKKAKTEAGDNGSDIPENAQTVVIDKVVEEGDDVGEAAALFEDAVGKLEKNPTEALTLLRGTIHESDRILRNWESEQPLPPIFYYTYGSALYELGRLTEDEEFSPFLEAAEERLQDGFDHLKAGGDPTADQEVVNKMNISLGKIWLAKAAMSVDADSKDIPELALKALDTLDKTFTDSKVEPTLLLDVASIVQNHGDLYLILESRSKFTQWAEEIFKRVLQDDASNARALSEIGLHKLSLANYWLERMDEVENKGQVDQTKRTLEEENAYLAILEAKKYFINARDVLEKSGSLSPQTYTDLAETYLNEANLTMCTEEQRALYEKVVECIDQARTLADGSDYILPEGLEIFLDEWINDDKR
ncbi:nuclear pore complex subunit Nro1-domain-containing protein [Absidia repens]|uniref:Nuclear pore complex subunit Nro1-domain-containing protein n=1 Tax=Absidia repens TaxID=90262 RepID=A0A1X2J0X8_9FUNG|nr:nuclear pore complex subunit Nro1-domain-containing protein [Absidia repens]